MAITTMDGLVAGLPGQRKRLYKTSLTGLTAGQFTSLWQATGFSPAGATPPTGVGEVPTSATTGAIPFTNPSSGINTYLATAAFACVNPGMLILYDRLEHNSGLVGNITTAQTFASTALTRPDANGADVELWVEVFTAIGATQHVLTATYVNQAGTTARSATLTNPNVSFAGQMYPFALQAGDTGVRSVSQVIWDVSTGTAGNFGVVFLRRIAEIPLSLANVAVILDAFGTGMAQVYDNACLALLMLPSATSTGTLIGSAVLAQG